MTSASTVVIHAPCNVRSPRWVGRIERNLADTRTPSRLVVVYKSDMSDRRLTDQDIERLLSGKAPEDEEFAALSAFVEILRAGATHTPSQATVEHWATEASELARSARLDLSPRIDAVGRYSQPRRSTLRIKRKIAVVLASLFVLAGLTGVAVAADDAAPGDALYSLDTALASIGIFDGGPAEVANEAAHLATEGKIAEALAHAANAVAQAGSDGDDEAEDEEEVETEDEVETENDVEGAVEALNAAATSVRSNDNEVSFQTRDNVATMIEAIATQLSEGGQVDGEAVAAMAKEIAELPVLDIPTGSDAGGDRRP